MAKYKNFVIIWLCLIAVLAFFILLARLLTPEDDWICSNGKWVKHGVPVAPMPKGECR
jgi:hypothetical protein